MIDFSKEKGFICDMDGVIYHGNQVLPGVVEFIDWLHKENKEFLFLTNNSGYTPRELQQKLARMGLDVSEEHFYTSALATAAFLKEQAPGCSVYSIGEAGLLNALYDAGITMNDVNPDYVVIGEGKSYSLDTLTKATNLVLKGAKLIGANSDLTGPIENGIAPACRALIAPIELATGKQAYFCGKPNPLMMRTGLNILGCHSAEAVMVGDRMDTDVISGMECGMLVLVPGIRKIFNVPDGASLLAAIIVLAIMILPSIIKMSITALDAVPKEFEDASLALGATPIETYFKVSVPAAKSGIAAAVVLGVGRAIGEAMAVMMVAGNVPNMPDSLFQSVRFLTTAVSSEMAYSSGLQRQALFSIALVLFLFIMLINAALNFFLKREKE